jgi:hypothetical protein
MKHTFLLAALIFAVTAAAQSDLKFNSAKLVTNTVQTVPADKVWKITALSGALYNTLCVGRPDLLPNPVQWVKAAVASGFEVNGSPVYSTLRYSTSTSRHGNNTCTNELGTTDYSSWSQNTDPLILPMWLPAGTTLRTLGAGIFVSVVEFDVIP